MNEMSHPVQYPYIDENLSSEQYHGHGAISRSGLWTIYNKTPAHYRFSERSESRDFDFGTAVHTAILEPSQFEKRVMRGPADRRGNLWKDSVAEANNQGRMILTAGDYEAVLEIRDAVHANAFINSLVTGGDPVVEASAFWAEDINGVPVPCKARPDLVRRDLGLMLDVKTAASASKAEFERSVANYGYHAQEYFYSRGWAMAGGGRINGTVFLVIEKEAPYAMALFELDPASVAEGGAAMHKALEIYAKCNAANHWPAYPEEVQAISIPKWAFRETSQP